MAELGYDSHFSVHDLSTCLDVVLGLQPNCLEILVTFYEC